MTLDEHYICQRAANAIISEIGPFRVSTDALQAINQFLDEFIVLLLTCSLSLDLSQIKSVVFSLLPSTLGKNAIVEAELEVKTFTETESIDYELYERMRNLGGNSDEDSRFPLIEAVPLLREKCFEYCTLADKDDQLYLQKSIRKRNEANMKVIISPIVAIYVTTVMEHIAEYLLTAVAMTAEHEETDYVRVKEVFLALIDDIQLGDVFNRMDLRDKMEKRAGLSNNNRPRNSYLPPPSPNFMNRKNYTLDQQQETGSFLDITFDDLDLDYFEDNSRKSTISNKPEIIRPNSAMSTSSNYTLNTGNVGIGANINRKSTFHLFKNNRNSFSNAGGDVPPRASSPIGGDSNSVYDPDAPSMNFDELIKSGGTVKVSLTPNRLRSIETKDELTPPPLTWERRSTSSPRLSSAAGNTTNTSSSRPSFPLVRKNTSNSVRSTSSSGKRSTHSNHSHHSYHHTTNHDQQQQSTMTIEVPKINARPSTPSSPLSKKSFSTSTTERFENPRDAPKPPPTPITAITPLSAITVSSTPMMKSASSPVVMPVVSTQSPVIKKSTTPLPKLTPEPQATTTTPTKLITPSIRSNNSICSEISFVPSIPSPIVAMPVPPLDNLLQSTTAITQEPPVPKPTKSIPLHGMVIRRSSVSNKKSRDNLRRAKEEQQQQKILNDDPMPTMVIDSTITATVKEQEESPIVLTEEPSPLETTASRQVHFDPTASEETTTVVLGDDATTITASPTLTMDGPISPTSEDTNMNSVGTVIPRKKTATLSPERPSSMVAKRASMVGNSRRRSLHESYATEKYHHQDILLRQRVSTVGSVSVSIKQWDDILKPEEQSSAIPPAAHRRSVLRQLRQQQLKEQLQLQDLLLDQPPPPPLPQGEGGKSDVVTVAEGGIYLNATNNNSNAVLDKVLKFERASSLDDVAHQRVSHMPRRERFLYLQQDPSAIERKSTIATKKVSTVPPMRRHVVGIDQGIQTDSLPETIITPPCSIKKGGNNEDDEDDEDEKKNTSDSEDDDEEHGLVDGDEEWFLQDDEWDEQEETAIVEWLLGE